MRTRNAGTSTSANRTRPRNTESVNPRPGPGRKKKNEARGELSAQTGQEILSLQRAAQEAHTRYLLTVGPVNGASPMNHGQFLLNEIAAALGWHFNDGVEDEKDQMLASIEAAHAEDPRTSDALASALDDYAHLADRYRDEIDGLGGFSASNIDEAFEVAASLRDRPTQAQSVTMSVEARQALDLRNKIVTVLLARMNLVRAAAKFVYRAHPEIVREATSAYERRRRATARRAKAKPAEPVAAPAPAVG